MGFCKGEIEKYFKLTLFLSSMLTKKEEKILRLIVVRSDNDPHNPEFPPENPKFPATPTYQFQRVQKYLLLIPVRQDMMDSPPF